MRAAIRDPVRPLSSPQYRTRPRRRHQSSPTACCAGCCRDCSAAIPDTSSSPPPPHVPAPVTRSQGAESGPPTPCRRSPAPPECCPPCRRAAPSHPPPSTEALREFPQPSPHRKSGCPSADSALAPCRLPTAACLCRSTPQTPDTIPPPLSVPAFRSHRRLRNLPAAELGCDTPPAPAECTDSAAPGPQVSRRGVPCTRRPPLL